MLRDLVQRLFQGDALEGSIRHTLERIEESLRAIVGVGRLQALDAHVALAGRMILVATNRDDAAVFVQRQHHPAGADTDPAK